MGKTSFTDVISFKEKHCLGDAFIIWCNRLCPGKTVTHIIFSEIIYNTVHANQFEWFINPVDYFLTPGNGFDGLLQRRQMYRSFRLLEDCGLIHVFQKGSRKNIRINLPGIVHAVRELWGKSNLRFKWKSFLGEWYTKFSDIWISHGWVLDIDIIKKQEHLMNLRDSVQEATKVSKEARTRQREKKMAKEEKSASFVIECMRQAYEEYYPDEKYTEIWTKKLKGMAKNWLAELQTTDPPIDPGFAVVNFVKYWHKLPGKVTDNYGNYLILGDLPKFQVYYRFRVQVEEGLRQIGKDSARESPFEGFTLIRKDLDTGETITTEY